MTRLLYACLAMNILMAIVDLATWRVTDLRFDMLWIAVVCMALSDEK